MQAAFDSYVSDFKNDLANSYHGIKRGDWDTAKRTVNDYKYPIIGAALLIVALRFPALIVPVAGNVIRVLVRNPRAATQLWSALWRSAVERARRKVYKK